MNAAPEAMEHFPSVLSPQQSDVAARRIRFGFEELGLGEVVSFTVPANQRCRAVMERLGLPHDPGEDLDHPELPARHPLRRHILYRLPVGHWRHR